MVKGLDPDALEEEILAALRRAYEGRRFDVAEHLLRALETIESVPQAGGVLAAAYDTIIASSGGKVRQ
jgi:hypothetical protein